MLVRCVLRVLLVLYLVSITTVSSSPITTEEDTERQIDCEDADLDSPVLYINGIAFDETNDNAGIVELEAEDNATYITLNIKLMSIQDQVVSYMTTNATNVNGRPSEEYYLTDSTLKTITMHRNKLTPVYIPLHQIQFHYDTRINFSTTFYFKCKMITIRTSIQFVKRTAIYGDPHFTVPLLNGESLCYSIQGVPGVPFNFLSNKHLIINAYFINSVNDPYQTTWIGTLAVMPQHNSTQQIIILDSVSQSIKIKGEGTFKPEFLRYISITKTGNIIVKTTSALSKQKGNPTVEVHFTNPMAVFYVTFHQDHLDIDWKMQSDEIDNSHGLLGQFISKNIRIDTTRQLLIRPGFEPVPVKPSKNWNSPDNCWVAKNVSNQGEGLIKGTVYDYIVDIIESTEMPPITL